jgi:hypothetical protein
MPGRKRNAAVQYLPDVAAEVGRVRVLQIEPVKQHVRERHTVHIHRMCVSNTCTCARGCVGTWQAIRAPFALGRQQTFPAGESALSYSCSTAPRRPAGTGRMCALPEAPTRTARHPPRPPTSAVSELDEAWRTPRKTPSAAGRRASSMVVESITLVVETIKFLRLVLGKPRFVLKETYSSNLPSSGTLIPQPLRRCGAVEIARGLPHS